ncbi:MAG: pyrroline-5-carboxylate reductase [Aquificaceae bacterium]|nr:pyrroline-5-carboxylate reductase [Aquificaceae bacterium]MCX8060934.1 pyrroline-5-carboxylate reductase [Aquificaceae bacterium]MDW8097682.1 pyrroline-5-carboxylate reductase [Aquificaceae bacterium]
MVIGVVGYGNMGESFARSLKGRAELLVYDTNPGRCESALKEGFGVAKDLEFLLQSSRWLLLAVKPKDAPEVLQRLRGKLKDRLLVSVVAGLSLSKMEELTGSSSLVRLMPNINALVGRATIACAFARGVQEREREEFVELFSSCGSLYTIGEELFDAFTALAGSGPAFVFKFVHALALAGLREGFSYETAKSIAVDVVLGSCELLKQKGGNPEDWLIRVASPAGTTVEGVKVLEERGFVGTLMECVRKTSERAKTLL